MFVLLRGDPPLRHFLNFDSEESFDTQPCAQTPPRYALKQEILPDE